MRPELPAAALVFHEQFDQLTGRLAARSEILEKRNETWEGVEARGFKSSLVKRIKLDEVEADWAKACGSFWPLSILKKRSVKKRLASYLGTGGTADPEVDLPLLRDHKDAVDALEDNLSSLMLPKELESQVEENPTAIQPGLDGSSNLLTLIH